jgi:hypothetical protein
VIIGRRPLAVAVVNGLVVLSLPLFVSALLGQHYDSTVHPPGWGPVAGITREIIAALPMAPWALVAAWRSWVHARRWSSGDRGWMGVVEAGACGVVFAVLVVSPVLANPRWAGVTAIAGAFGLVVGIAVGLVLQAAGVGILLVGRTRAG